MKCVYFDSLLDQNLSPRADWQHINDGLDDGLVHTGDIPLSKSLMIWFTGEYISIDPKEFYQMWLNHQTNGSGSSMKG